MAEIAGSSWTPSNNNKPVVVRVKRKAFQSPLEAFWLEINERPLKRPLLDFEKLSISDSSVKVVELKTKKVFLQHVETTSSSKVTVDTLQSFVPNFADASESKAAFEERRRGFKTNKKQDQLPSKAKQQQEVLSKNARFEQIWRSRKGKREMMHDEAVHEMCHFYDVVRVDVEGPTNEVQVQEDTDLEDHMLMSSYLPLLREFIPSAASEIESDIHDYMSTHAYKDDYVYDLYAMKDDVDITEDDASNPFPLVQVEEDDFYDGPSDSELESDDSNAENNPLNDYPDEESSEDEDEVESRTSNDESEVESASDSDEPSNSKKIGNCDLSEDEYATCEGYNGEMYHDDGDGEQYY